MPDRMEATALALDAYQQQLLPDEVFSHRTDSSLAELLIQSLIEQLARYAAQQGLDIHATLEELHQRSIDRGGTRTDPVHNFRLGGQVQFRQEVTAPGAKPQYPRWRGFITSLTEASGGDARCTVRVPAVAEAVHVTASELEPAEPLLPVPTRTVGVVHHARDAEQAIVALTAWLERNADTVPVTYQEKLDDVARLSEALANWSGGRPEEIARHLPSCLLGAVQSADTPAAEGSGLAPVARLAAMGFPQGPAPVRPADPPAVTRLPGRSERRPRRP
ncbi:hypothetical protein [Actinomadura nitritigenes]|uniref:hypothetical protein n=1 Tax=Actinomadura nitritigenes TaxID=134602 RepID=UPI003D8B70FA